MLAREVEARMLERLQYIKLDPARILDAAAAMAMAPGFLQNVIRARTSWHWISLIRCCGPRAAAMHGCDKSFKADASVTCVPIVPVCP